MLVCRWLELSLSIEAYQTNQIAFLLIFLIMAHWIRSNLSKIIGDVENKRNLNSKSMKVTVEEVVLSGTGLSHVHGEIYELLGLDVIYDRDSLKIYNTRTAKIKSISSGIHIHTHHETIDLLVSKGLVGDHEYNTPLEMVDLMGNRIVVTFMGLGGVNRIAIVTSGGDAPGMNSAIKSIIRTGIKWGASVYGVYKGYDGLINDNIRKLSWDTETYNSSQGGTVLLSARSKKFMDMEGRKQAVLNMIRRGINCMVVLGGDGSLQGALTIEEEFKDHFRELIKEKKISIEEIRRLRSDRFRSRSETEADGTSVGYSDFYGKPECYKASPTVYHGLNPSNAGGSDKDPSDFSGQESHACMEAQEDRDIEQYIYDLKVVAIPATIDNDIYGAAVSLGQDTALYRVVESIDHLMSTMKSHSRAFVIEVMGRKCGWIALMSALASAADYVLLPEAPTSWRTDMIETLKVAKKYEKPGVFVIVAEGAVEVDGTPISTSQVVREIDNAGIEVRFLKLGHIQRGGPTSAQDRIHGTLLGIKAVEIMLGPIKEPTMISVFKDDFREISLKEVIEKNRLIEKLQEETRFEEVLIHRSNFFRLAHSYFNKSNMSRINTLSGEHVEDCIRSMDVSENDNESVCRACIEERIESARVRMGAGCPDEEMNVRSSSSRDISRRVASIGILQSGQGSSGMNAALNSVVQYALAVGLKPYYIPNGFEGLLEDQVVEAKLYEFSSDVNNGGSAIGVSTCKDIDVEMVKAKLEKFKLDALVVIGDSKTLFVLEKIRDVNIVLIPTSSSNNIPGIDLSVGADTALNIILKISDVSKLNSFAHKNNAFVIEVGGEHCGFLSLMGGIAAGAFDVFIPERKYLVTHLSEAAQRLRVRFRERPRRGIVIFRNEKTFCSMSTESFCKALKTDNEDLFETDYSVLGQLQQGSNPSPTDRINAMILGIKAVDLCLENCGVGVVGFLKDAVEFTKIEDVMDKLDRKYIRVKDPHWLKYSHICRSIE